MRFPIPSPVPKFDIFCGRFPDPNVVWVDAVEGLAAACKRMEQIAAEKPGRYFVFNASDRTVLATTDTHPSESHIDPTGAWGSIRRTNHKSKVLTQVVGCKLISY
jgi:hypothetical protein